MLIRCDCCDKDMTNELDTHICDMEDVRKYISSLNEKINLSVRQKYRVEDVLYNYISSNYSKITDETLKDFLSELMLLNTVSGSFQHDNVDSFIHKWSAIYDIAFNAYRLFQDRHGKRPEEILEDIREACIESLEPMKFTDVVLDKTVQDIVDAIVF